MKNYLDVMIDLETLSRRPNAAIIQIAAKPFKLDGGNVKGTGDSFHVDVDATSCAMYGMDFDKDTIDWWSKNKPANEYFKTENVTYRIRKALIYFAATLKNWCKQTGADDIIVWCQGSDFDIAILREAYRRVFGSEEKVPWRYRNVRDARTYFLEAARLYCPDNDDPYKLIKTDGTKHTALADCEWSIKAVQWAYEKYNLWNENFGKGEKK